nr:MAG TPA_asm: hypothetical protein [Bacteriophage sp.]
MSVPYNDYRYSVSCNAAGLMWWVVHSLQRIGFINSSLIQASHG